LVFKGPEQFHYKNIPNRNFLHYVVLLVEINQGGHGGKIMFIRREETAYTMEDGRLGQEEENLKLAQLFPFMDS
jgi:hypothetical protein